jgi:hypothetical protein
VLGSIPAASSEDLKLPGCRFREPPPDSRLAGLAGASQDGGIAAGRVDIIDLTACCRPATRRDRKDATRGSFRGSSPGVGRRTLFSLHAGVAARANERDKIERLCRYIARPALASSRLSLTREGLVRYAFKTPWRDGTTHVLFEPLDFIARLAALIPRPGVNLTRYHGILAPNSPLRALVTPACRGKRVRGTAARTEPEKRRAMTWARRLKRVFRVDIEKCVHCGGAAKIIACIQNPNVIGRILDHLKRTGALTRDHPPQAPRAPPRDLFPSPTTKSD